MPYCHLVIFPSISGNNSDILVLPIFFFYFYYISSSHNTYNEYIFAANLLFCHSVFLASHLRLESASYGKAAI